MNRFSSTLLAFVCISWTMIAQDFRATINGTVTDSSGAVVPDAQISVTSVERTESTRAMSNNTGTYTVQDLLPGTYVLTIKRPGFKTLIREGIKLEANDHIGLDLQMDLGSLSDQVTVSGEPPLVQTENGSISTTIPNQVIENVPSNGRNIYQFQYTLPGVIKASNYWGSMELYAFGNVNGVSIGGGRVGENETLVDGVTDTHSDRGVAWVPPLAGTQELSLQSNQYDAAYGRVGGGVTSVSVKSGTNQLHGQIFEFLKNDILNANDWVANSQGSPRKKFENNTFGFEVAGPVILPKLFNGRNHLFFMLSLEELRESAAGGTLTTVPTAAERTGDFSQLFNNAGQPVTIYDPLTTHLAVDSITEIRNPFPGNKIPAGRLNQTAVNAINYFPLPKSAGDNGTNVNNFYNTTPAINIYQAWLGKLDYRANDRNNISFHYGQTPWTDRENVVWGTNAAEPSHEFPATRVSHNTGFDWTSTLSPNMVFDLRGGLARYSAFSGNELGRNFDPSRLGFSPELVAQFSHKQFPYFNFDGGNTYSQLGNSFTTQYQANDAYSLAPGLSWARGRHFLKFGAELRLYNDNLLQPGSASGEFDFDQGWTQATPNQADNLSGNEMASFLLGYPANGVLNKNIDPAYHNFYFATFVQDDFKLRPSFTLNLGLRWDVETPRKERYNRQVVGFASNTASPIASLVSAGDISNCPACSALKGGLQYAGANGNSIYPFKTDWNNFGPRIGFAWAFRPSWVVRGGYGLMYLGQSSNGPNTGYSQSTYITSSLDGGNTPAATLYNPFINGILQPLDNTQGLSSNLGQNVSAPYRDRPLPYSQQYSLGIQHEFRGGWLTDLSYVGNRTSKLPETLNLNFLSAAELQSVPEAERSSYFTTTVANPMAGAFPGSSLSNSTVTRAQLLFAFPQYSQLQMTDVPIGSQRYDSMQAKLKRRFANGLTFQASYTWSKTLEKVSVLNPSDVNLTDLTKTWLEKHLGQFDTPHNVSFVVTYELPFGRGKQFGSNVNRWVNGIAGGWNINVETIWRRGFPMMAASNACPSGNVTENHPSNWDVSSDYWINTSLYSGTALSTYDLRTCSTRYPNTRLPNFRSTEMSVFKQFSIKERTRIQFRVDGQNVFNTPYFGHQQSTNVTDSTFGQLTGDESNESRLIVGVLKILF